MFGRLVLIGLVLLAVFAGDAAAQGGGAAPPFENLQFTRGSAANQLVVRGKVPASYDAAGIFVELKQPSSVSSAQSGGKDCQVSQNQNGISGVACPGPFEARTEFTIVIQTSGYPDNGGARVGGATAESPSRPIQETDVDGPGPAGAGNEGTYDLVMGPIPPITPFSVDPDHFLDFRNFSLTALRVRNVPAATRSSIPTSFTVSSDPAVLTRGHVQDAGRRSESACDPFSSGILCEIPALAPGELRSVHPRIDFVTALTAPDSTVRFRIELSCRPPQESSCDNHSDEESIEFVLSGDSAVARQFRALRVFRMLVRGNERPAGSQRVRIAAVAPEDRPRRGEIAVLRLGRGQRGFSGPEPLEPPTGARRCAWLSSAQVRFRRRPIGPNRTCQTPIWLRARGVPRATYRLRRPLPPGRYVIYTRAVTRAGAVETSFTNADRNRGDLRVPRRR